MGVYFSWRAQALKKFERVSLNFTPNQNKFKNLCDFEVKIGIFNPNLLNKKLEFVSLWKEGQKLDEEQRRVVNKLKIQFRALLCDFDKENEKTSWKGVTNWVKLHNLNSWWRSDIRIQFTMSWNGFKAILVCIAHLLLT